MRRAEWFAEIAQDLRYGWRTMLHAPAFTIIAVLSLAVGIGANTAIFGLLHKIVLAKLPVPDPDRLVQITVQMPGMSGPISQAFRDEQLEAIRGLPGVTFSNFGGASLEIAAGEEKSPYGFEGVAGSFFSLLGVRALQGRLITPEDERTAAHVVVISESLWKHFWPGDVSAVGKVVHVNDLPFTVIGVTPASYQGVTAFGAFNAAIPLTTLRQIRRPNRSAAGPPMSVVIGRLDEGVSAAALSPILHERLMNCCKAMQGNTQGNSSPLKSKGGVKGGAAASGKGAAPEGPPRFRLELTSMNRGMPGKFDVRGQYSAVLYSLMGGVLVLLLVACANVGTLLLARAEARQRELAVRYSLGAVRTRLVRQLLTESLQLALLGAVLGYFLSRWGLHAFAGRIERGLLSDLMLQQPDRVVLGFTTIVTAASTVLFGVLPARRATRIDVLAQLKEGGQRLGGRRTGMLDRALIVLQVALALLLVTTAGLLVQTLRNLKNFDAGFNASNLLLVRADFGRNSGGGGFSGRPVFAEMFDDDVILQRIQQLPGVRAAALASTAPVMGGSIWIGTINVSGYTPAPEENVSAKLNAVTPGYFAAAGIALRAGRVFSPADQVGTEPVAVVSETFARRFLAGRNPIGVVVKRGADSFRIIGVVEDARYSNLREPEMPWLYLSSAQKAGNEAEPLAMLIRTMDPPADLAEVVQREMLAAGQIVVIRNVTDMRTAIKNALIRERMAAILGTLFGSLALALAALGLYGVIAYQVAGRTMEIGTRMALGARSSRVLWLVLRQSIGLLVIGFMVGVPLALVAARALGTQLFGVRAFDPLTLGGALLVLTITGIAASLVPARRATLVDPMTALRAS